MREKKTRNEVNEWEDLKALVEREFNVVVVIVETKSLAICCPFYFTDGNFPFMVRLFDIITLISWATVKIMRRKLFETTMSMGELFSYLDKWSRYHLSSVCFYSTLHLQPFFSLPSAFFLSALPFATRKNSVLPAANAKWHFTLSFGLNIRRYFLFA